MSVVYDAGFLIAADRNDRRAWADHRERLRLGRIPLTTAPVVAQVYRSERQAQLRRLLRSCDVVPFLPAHSYPVGSLLARAKAPDVVDGHLAYVAASSTPSKIITSDVRVLERLASHLFVPMIIAGLGKQRT